jgi:hypothetical protein
LEDEPVRVEASALWIENFVSIDIAALGPALRILTMVLSSPPQRKEKRWQDVGISLVCPQSRLNRLAVLIQEGKLAAGEASGAFNVGTGWSELCGRACLRSRLVRSAPGSGSWARYPAFERYAGSEPPSQGPFGGKRRESHPSGARRCGSKGVI